MISSLSGYHILDIYMPDGNFTLLPINLATILLSARTAQRHGDNIYKHAGTAGARLRRAWHALQAACSNFDQAAWM
jgi:hypothetical protein